MFLTWIASAFPGFQTLVLMVLKVYVYQVAHLIPQHLLIAKIKDSEDLKEV